MHLVLACCGKILLSELENNNKELEKDNSKWLKIAQTELADWDFSDWIKSVWEEMWQIPRNIITGMEKVNRIDCSNTKDKEHGLKLEASKQSYFFNVNAPVKSSPQDAVTWKISGQDLGKSVHAMGKNDSQLQDCRRYRSSECAQGSATVYGSYSCTCPCHQGAPRWSLVWSHSYAFKINFI